MILTLPTHISTKYIFQPSGVENVGNISSKSAILNFIEFLSLIIRRLNEFYNFIWNPILSLQLRLIIHTANSLARSLSSAEISQVLEIQYVYLHLYYF